MASCTTHAHIYSLCIVSNCVVWLVWLELVSPLWAPGWAAALAAPPAPSTAAVAAFVVAAPAYRR